MDFEYIKQVVVSLAFNPPSGVISHSQPLIQGLVLSSKRCLIISHELTQYAYLNSSGIPLSTYSVDVLITRTPSSNLDDSSGFAVGSGVVRVANLPSQLYYQQVGTVERPVNMLVDGSQQFDVNIAIRFSGLSGSLDYVSLIYRLFFKEL